MSLNPVKVWRMEPGLADYRPGMDLGVPDDIFQPESLVRNGKVIPTIVSPNSQKQTRKQPGPSKRLTITKKEYLQLRKTGLSRADLAKRFNYTLGSFSNQLRKWGINNTKLELEAIEELSNKQHKEVIRDARSNHKA